MYSRSCWLTVIYSVFCIAAYAQAPAKKEIADAVDKMAVLLKERYVSEEKGLAIAAYLRTALQTGKFTNVKSWQEFAQLATTSLQDFSHDGHLYVRNDPMRCQELLAADKAALPATAVGNTSGEDPFFYSPVAADHNYGFESVRIAAGNVGYLHLSEINISRKSLSTLYAAMAFVAHTSALVIDLRNNGGGGSDTGAVFESYFLPSETPLLTFTSRTGEHTTDSTVTWLKEPHYERPVFILINRKTASAAEAFAFVLQKMKRATVIGEPSAGAANMNVWLPVNKDIFISVSEMAPVWHGTTDSWEQRGVQPDCAAQTEAAIDACIHDKIGRPKFRPVH
ncbi:S41 family peptidase [Chitinophaga pinensis]|uniref:Peptidase S41 n=1 Tax=Chitinophaga pinensis (strain ATCC 43595 / DSM 2588 / LMG 13176 / NBRC 15968 / NCIMB 11800 / UQM 2034) TaxID=485918 RepID=A0A979G2M7_CHIPD|nr:S41 family peptidase [Chitinophaga pinensis]ACU59518.1 peptidase S41 [Chitinophaga pinensis DSM 2588]